jgi:hypothetical protein
LKEKQKGKISYVNYCIGGDMLEISPLTLINTTAFCVVNGFAVIIFMVGVILKIIGE